MARIRTIKPTFFTSLTIADLSLHARLTFIGLWTHCDDEGRCLADPRLIRAALWPLDDRSLDDIKRDLGALRESSLITLYEVAGRHYIAINGWSEHQKISKPTESKLPSPDSGRTVPPTSPNGTSRRTPGGLPEGSSQEGKGREQGREGIPPSAGATAPQPGTTLALVPDPEHPPAVAEPVTAQTLVADWIDDCAERPPGRVVGQIARELGLLFGEGIDPTHIRAGLAAWHNAAKHPSTLASFVNEVMNASSRRKPPNRPNPNGNQDMLQRAMARAQAKEASGL